MKGFLFLQVHIYTGLYEGLEDLHVHMVRRKGVWEEERGRLGLGLGLAPTINQSLLLVYLYSPELRPAVDTGGK